MLGVKRIMKLSEIKLPVISSLTAMLILSGCYSSSNNSSSLTAEQKQVFLNALMNKMQQANPRLGASSFQLNHTPNMASEKTKAITEKELLEKINSYPKLTSGVHFTQRSDGFIINDSSVYVDYEGKIVKYGYNWKNGNIFYIIETSLDRYKIKFQRANSGMEPLFIANVARNGANFIVRTATGKTINGSGIIPTSEGFIVLRKDTAFIYRPGHGITTFVTPKGWHIAQFQNGDVASTNFILLERNKEVDESNPIGNLMNETKELANIFGLTEKSDYMLINVLNPNEKQLINITLGDKEIQILSQCRQSSKYIRVCQHMDVREGLYEPNGLKNFSHYYWNINWFVGKNRVFSVTKEATGKKVLITDLKTGKKVEAAYRITGFPGLTTEQDENGVVSVHVDGGLLPSVDISDAEDFLEKNEPINVKSN